MNKCIITGRLGKPPEVKFTNTGKCVATFSIAVKRNKTETDWIDVVAWEKTGELVGDHLTKGSNVLVEGRIQVRTYEKDGQKRKITEVVAERIEFLDSKQQVQQQANNNTNLSSMGSEVFDESEICF